MTVRLTPTRRVIAKVVPCCELVVVQEAAGSWTFHGPDEPGVRMTEDMAVSLAKWILAGAQ